MYTHSSGAGSIGRLRRLAAPIVIATSVASLIGVSLHTGALETAAATPTGVPATVATAGSPPPRGFADLAERIVPTVVNIATKRIGGPGQVRAPAFELPPGSPFGPQFREFFERFFENVPRTLPRYRGSAAGSGFVVDPEGLIVTNHHVVRDADEITVTLHDGRRFEAVLRGIDDNTDLALLSIPAEEPLPYAEFGDSDALRVGDWVVAVGNPFGLGGTVTAGIVSARGRDIRSGPLDDFLQIDAPINRGSSGGPLFDSSGHVVGVNTAIFSPSGGNVGIGFAIPARQAREVVEDLATHGRVERGWMGVQIQTLTEAVAENLGLETAQGALVVEVFEASPAEAAGLRVGDVVLEFDAEAVTSSRRLPHLVAEAENDEAVPVVVWRDGERKALSLVVGRRPAADGLAMSPPAGAKGEAQQPSLGLTLAPLTPRLRARYELADDLEGALVIGVDAGGAAAAQGLRAGDVVVRAGNEPITAPADVAGALRRTAQSGKKSVLLLVERGGARHFVAVPIG